jgi:hypothetical protein
MMDAMPADEATPIACSLRADALGERLDEWRVLVATHVSSVESSAASVRLVLDGSDAALLAAASLGAREKECCPFFDVTIELESARRSLRLAVPAGAEPVLGEFVSLLRS